MLQMPLANLINQSLEAIDCDTDYSGKLLVILGAGVWQLSGIRAAKQLNFTVLAVDADSEAPGLALVDYPLCADPCDIPNIIKYLKTLNQQPIGVVAFITEALQLAAAKLRELLKLPGPNSDLISRMTDKALQRQCWQTHGISNPAWHVFNQAKDAVSFLGQRRLDRYIIKPANSSGSRGITVIDAETSTEKIQEGVGLAFQFSSNGKILIEQFIKGVEYAVETFSHNGHVYILAISEKCKVAGTDDTVASELATPAISSKAQQEIGSLVQRALLALNYQNGPAHTEILRTKEGNLYLVETGARGGGFLVADGIVPAASHFNLPITTILSTVGATFSFSPPRIQQCFVLRFIPSRPGVVKAIIGFETISQIEGVSACPLVKIGDTCFSPRTDGGRLAYIFSIGKTREEALKKANEATDSINFEVN